MDQPPDRLDLSLRKDAPVFHFYVAHSGSTAATL
jgi:hypothetical protein